MRAVGCVLACVRGLVPRAGGGLALFGYFNRNAGPESSACPSDPATRSSREPSIGATDRLLSRTAVQACSRSRSPKDRRTSRWCGRSPWRDAPWLFPQTSLIKNSLSTVAPRDGRQLPGQQASRVEARVGGPGAQGTDWWHRDAEPAAVGTPLPLEVWVSDDGLPPPLGPVKPGGPPRRALTVTWSEFRGPSAVSFAQPSPTIEGGGAVTSATFKEPGDYVLRAVASDGSGFSAQCCWTNGCVRDYGRGRHRAPVNRNTTSPWARGRVAGIEGRLCLMSGPSRACRGTA